MKRILITLLIVLFAKIIYGQMSGNINYHKSSEREAYNPNLYEGYTNIINLSIRGLANIKADTYVAIFAITQNGKTAEETNKLIDIRVKKALEGLQSEGVETYVDMLSFVPSYEYETDKKIFSKTYTEVPAGFELKKNIHVKFTDYKKIDNILSAMASAEIYDLVKVEYYSSQIEAVKKTLRDKARNLLAEKQKSYEEILAVQFTSMHKHIADGYTVTSPADRYNSYSAYNSQNTPYTKKFSKVRTASKSATMYYEPIDNSSFDFVINSVILEPVIQIVYEIRLKINTEEEEKINKEYLLISPNGEVKKLEIE